MESFRTASDHVVQYLLSHWGWACWTVGRVEERDGLWIVLATASATESAVRAGSVLSWPRTLCAGHIADGARVTVGMDACTVDGASPAEGLRGISAHASAAIRRPDGQIAATLCGSDVSSRAVDTGPLVATLDTFAELLGLVLAGQERADAAARRADAMRWRR